uniref:Uncharacterized protein n=1 Tax=Glossina austeni TaxID=7395 RepID=A0A1A9V6Z5_GLOAU
MKALFFVLGISLTVGCPTFKLTKYRIQYEDLTASLMLISLPDWSLVLTAKNSKGNLASKTRNLAVVSQRIEEDKETSEELKNVDSQKLRLVEYKDDWKAVLKIALKKTENKVCELIEYYQKYFERNIKVVDKLNESVKCLNKQVSDNVKTSIELSRSLSSNY